MREDEAFEIVANELESNLIDKGLWLKAYTNKPMNQQETKTEYIKLRVEQLLSNANAQARKIQNEKIQSFIYENRFQYGIVALSVLIFVLGPLASIGVIYIAHKKEKPKILIAKVGYWFSWLATVFFMFGVYVLFDMLRSNAY